MKDRRYWDTDAFLGWLQAEPGKEEMCRGVLDAAKGGRVLIVTSALTLAEALALRGRPKIPVANKQAVVDFFKHEYIAVQNVTRKIAEIARDLVWDFGIDPKDAIHVATALHVRVPMLNTFDEGLLKKTGQVGSPALKIEKPHYTAQVQLGLQGDATSINAPEEPEP